MIIIINYLIFIILRDLEMNTLVIIILNYPKVIAQYSIDSYCYDYNY